MKLPYIFLFLAILILIIVSVIYGQVSQDNELSTQTSPNSIATSPNTGSSQSTATENTPSPSSPTPQSSVSPATFSFGSAKKSAHYVSNVPTHGATLTNVPADIKISFNFDLAKPSAITIIKDAVDYGVGETTISADKLVLSRAIRSDAPNGLYTVNYTACWPDTSCHTGNFQFAINK